MPNNACTIIEFEPYTEVSKTHPHSQQYTMDEPLRILLVEDNASDAMLTEMALDSTFADYELYTMDNGKDVMPYLHRQGKFKDEHKPDMLLLDLSLPTKDGFEVLSEMAMQSERFGDIPVVIQTGDRHSEFLKHTYGLNIVAYITKPCTATKLRRAFASMKSRRK